MYLIYQFSQLVDISVKVTDIAGVTHRIAQILERMKYLQGYWPSKYPPGDSNFSKLQDFEDLAKRRDHVGDSKRQEFIPAWVLDKVSFTAPYRQKFLAKGKT